MSRRRLAGLVLLGLLVACFAAAEQQSAPGATASAGLDSNRLQRAIESHLGRPYVFGTSGLRTFDCSGFVWRVFRDCGLFLKRTSARKLAVCLPRTENGGESAFGTIVFFNNLKHCGIVRDESGFYHAQSSKGTTFTAFDDYWRPRVCGYRAIVPGGS